MKWLFGIFVFLTLIVSGCVSTSESSSTAPSPIFDVKQEAIESGGTKTTISTPISETIHFQDENSSGTITKNTIDKTAIVSMEMSLEQPSDQFDLTLIGSLIICGAGTTALFDPETFEKAVTELGDAVTAWNQEYGDGTTVEKKKQSTSENILEGYTVKSLSITINHQGTKQKVASCTAVGKEEDQREIVFYGKYVQEYEDYKKNQEEIE